MTLPTNLDSLIARSFDTEAPPSYTSSASVRCTGEALHEPVYWSGHQWAVTSHGIECRDGTYAIAKQRVWEDNEGYGWVEQLSEKNWVDLPDFVEALRLARQRWPKKGVPACVDSNDKETVSDSTGELLANEIHFASAFVTPFAAAVAVELEEFGLSKQKIDEIMLRSAKRFGAMNGEEPRSFSQNETDSDKKSADYLGWFKSTGGQAYDFLASVVGQHGPILRDKLAPVVMDALQQALQQAFSHWLKGGNPPPKSRR